MSRSPCILWVGDAGVPTGFARCTDNICNHLHEAGWSVHVLGINYYGDPDHGYPFDIWPPINYVEGCPDQFGLTRLPKLIDKIQPDIVVLLGDTWNVGAYMDAVEDCKGDAPPVVSWLAVDAENHNGAPLNRLAHVSTWTQFGIDALVAGGYSGPSTVIPLGVDLNTFTPLDRTESRVALYKDTKESDFIIGVVGRNQWRKRLDLTIASFADLVHRCGVDNAKLFLHVAPTGEGGFDLNKLAKYFKIDDRVILSDPGVGHGILEEHLPHMYSAMDVYLSTTQGEGWGLPCMEAMACGVPCVVPAFGGLGEWTKRAALQVAAEEIAATAPGDGARYTIGKVATIQAVGHALNCMYVHKTKRLTDMYDIYSLNGLALVKQPEYRWPNIASRFETMLFDVINGQVSATGTDG